MYTKVERQLTLCRWWFILPSTKTESVLFNCSMLTHYCIAWKHSFHPCRIKNRIHSFEFSTFSNSFWLCPHCAESEVHRHVLQSLHVLKISESVGMFSRNNTICKIPLDNCKQQQWIKQLTLGRQEKNSSLCPVHSDAISYQIHCHELLDPSLLVDAISMKHEGQFCLWTLCEKSGELL